MTDTHDLDPKRVQLSDRVQWIRACHAFDGRHMHVSQYVVETDGGGHVLVDAGDGHAAEMVDAIEAGTDGEGPETLMLTHSILPHTGNVEALKAEWGDLAVVSASNIPQLVGLPADTGTKFINSTEEISGGEFTFLDPLLTDVVATNWVYSHDAKTLFTAEGVGHYHDPGECDATSRDLGGIRFDDVHDFHRDKLPFLEYVDPEKLRAGFETVFDELDVEWVAPTHGTPVHRSHLSEYVDSIVESADEFDYEPAAARADD